MAGKKLKAHCVRSRRGFTLIETLVALVIFGIITVAISLAFNTAVRTQEVNDRRQEELGAVRSIFDTLTRDIQAASGSANSQSSVFMSGSGGNGLLTFSTRSRAIQASEASDENASNDGSPFGIQSGGGAASSPQSDIALVRYDFDSQSETFKRSTLAVPNLTSFQPGGSDSQTIAKRIVSINFQYWDAANSSLRSDWDYEQTKQQSSDSSGTSSGAKIRGLGEGGANSNDQASSGDSSLPGFVKVSVTIRLKDGTTADYSTSILIIATQLQSSVAPPLSDERTPAKQSDSKSGGGT